jgi:hypothetical protein
VIRILITGSREVDGPAEVLISDVLAEVIKVAGPGATIVHGGARGVDTVASFWAVATGLQHEPHRADWDAHGKGAGHMRNAEMVALGASVCLAFPRRSSRGTWDCVRRAADAGIPVRIYPLPESP